MTAKLRRHGRFQTNTKKKLNRHRKRIVAEHAEDQASARLTPDRQKEADKVQAAMEGCADW